MENDDVKKLDAAIVAINKLKDATACSLEQFQKAFDGLITNAEKMQVALNDLIVDRNGQVELVGKLTEHVTTLARRVDVLTRLVDSDHGDILILKAKFGDFDGGRAN